MSFDVAFDINKVLYAYDVMGVAVFAITGGLLAARQGMDLFGFLVLGIATGVGGGTIRDLILGLPVFWVRDPNYLIVASVAGAGMFFFAHILKSLNRTLLWLDAAGMSLFAVAGAGWAMSLDAPLPIIIFMGVLTACGGGMIRDVLAGVVPLVFRREIYAIAAFAGAGLYGVLARHTDFDNWAMVAGLLTAFTLRGLSLRYDLSLPIYKEKQ